MTMTARFLPQYPKRIQTTGAITKQEANGIITLGFDYTLTELGTELAQAVDTTNVNSAATAADRVAAGTSETNAAASATAAAASAASLDLPAITANTIMVDNNGATAREAKTFAQVRTLLQVPSFSELPYVVASEYGVTGDGSDQTTALQAVYDAIPTTGGNVILPAGDVFVTNINLSTRRNIRTVSIAGTGAGAGQTTRILTAAGASAGRMFDLRDTVNVSFEDIYALATSSSHDGTMFDYGSITSGSSNMGMRNCYLQSNGPSAKVLSLYGSTTGSWERLEFAGPATLLALQTSGGVGFCNVHRFSSCNFNPTNQYPVVGGGDTLTFTGCNWQAGSSDGIARGINTGTSYNTRGITIIGCGFYDTLTAGGQWVVVPIASGVTVIGGYMGGAPSGTDYGIALGGTADGDPQMGGVRGVAVMGVTFDGLTGGIAFAGTSSANSNVRGGWAGGNHVVNGAMYTNIATVTDWTNLPNHVYDSQNDLGSHFGLFGMPTSASGLTSGAVWSNSGVLTIVG